MQGAWSTTGEDNSARLTVRLLSTLRWAVLAGQALGVTALALWLGPETVHLSACLAAITAGFAVNLLTLNMLGGARVLTHAEASGHIAFDILETALVLALTGGVGNPFILVLIAPVALAAATLPPRPLIGLAMLASLGVIGLAFTVAPLPGIGTDPPISYRAAAAAAGLAGIWLVAVFVRFTVAETARRQLALNMTQTVLAREQRLSALGGLAAAAAHELGTPLATIAIIAKELTREAPNDAVREDGELLMAQTQRCREILSRLTARPDAAHDALHERMTLQQLLDAVTEPHLGLSAEVEIETAIVGPPDTDAPDIRRIPEATHALSTFVENAVDFARSKITVTARHDAKHLTIEVRDDGPGFAPEILARLGEPYVTSRPGAEGSRTGHIGMGLGFFIGKTLLERSGATVDVRNAKPNGASITVRWSRAKVEAS
jgi:two-component system sensor histidine kinase RegB